MSGDKVVIIPDIPLVACQPSCFSPVEEGNEKVERVYCHKRPPISTDVCGTALSMTTDWVNNLSEVPGHPAVHTSLTTNLYKRLICQPSSVHTSPGLSFCSEKEETRHQLSTDCATIATGIN
ncbi:hypothetical protein Q8A73_018283 [Channa argus]|nr:hypothetical protein Q8A73_018283 [Channa argus]